MENLLVNNIFVATGNAHKLEEIEAVFQPLGITVEGLGVLDWTPDEPVEDGDTFEANARLKAIGYAEATGRICLADDSGLEVDALDGEPGIYSARWSGVNGSREERDAANNALLMKRMRDVADEDRAARFVCAMCIATPKGEILAETRGNFEGVIAREPRGSHGFGYDPYLWLPEEGRTSAELSPEEKNARSHRGLATRAMAKLLNDIDLETT